MSAALESNDKMVTLQSCDGEIFEVEKAVAFISKFLKMMIEGEEERGKTETTIPVRNVSGKILKMVIPYCEYHHSHAAESADTLKFWDTEFVKPLVDDPPTLYALTMAAHYLDIYALLNVTCNTIVDMITGKTLEEIRRIFNIENDLFPEEEAAIRREHQWSLERN